MNKLCRGGHSPAPTVMSKLVDYLYSILFTQVRSLINRSVDRLIPGLPEEEK